MLQPTQQRGQQAWLGVWAQHCGQGLGWNHPPGLEQPQDDPEVGSQPWGHTWTGLLARGMDRSLLNSGGSRAGACPAKEGALAVPGWGHKQGEGEQEPAEPRLFELGIALFGLGSKPVEGKCPPQFTSSFLCALWASIPPHTRTQPNLSSVEDQQCPGLEHTSGRKG